MLIETFIINSHYKPNQGKLTSYYPQSFLPFAVIWVYNKRMIDNFFEEDSYHSYDKVYTDMVSQHSIYLGDAQAAMDNDFHMRC